MRFSWDEDKNIENQINHDGISFEEVVPMFRMGNYLVEFDSEHSTDSEDRYRAIGEIEFHGTVIAVFVEWENVNPDDDEIRIISVRKKD